MLCSGKPVAEDMEKLVLQVHAANKYSHILAPATASAKATLPRVAAKLDVNPVSDVLKIESEDTFVRPIYAGNAFATVTSSDSVKVCPGGVWDSARERVRERGKGR